MQSTTVRKGRSVTLSVRLERELYQFLENTAQARRMTLSQWVRALVIENADRGAEELRLKDEVRYLNDAIVMLARSIEQFRDDFNAALTH